MRIVVADCSAVYTGRGDTVLPRGRRVLIMKEDGSVSIHNEHGNKPLNYMKKATFSKNEEKSVWAFDANRESLIITIHDLIADTYFSMDEENIGLERDGTESHLQEWLSLNPTQFGENVTLVQREFNTGDGPVDILCVDDVAQELLVIEVKRVAMMPSVDQVRRYVEAILTTEPDGIEAYKGYRVRGIIAALDIRPKTYAMAEKRGMETHIVDRIAWEKRKSAPQTNEKEE